MVHVEWQSSIDEVSKHQMQEIDGHRRKDRADPSKVVPPNDGCGWVCGQYGKYDEHRSEIPMPSQKGWSVDPRCIEPEVYLSYGSEHHASAQDAKDKIHINILLANARFRRPS